MACRVRWCIPTVAIDRKRDVGTRDPNHANVPNAIVMPFRIQAVRDDRDLVPERRKSAGFGPRLSPDPTVGNVRAVLLCDEHDSHSVSMAGVIWRGLPGA